MCMILWHLNPPGTGNHMTESMTFYCPKISHPDMDKLRSVKHWYKLWERLMSILLFPALQRIDCNYSCYHQMVPDFIWKFRFQNVNLILAREPKVWVCSLDKICNSIDTALWHWRQNYFFLLNCFYFDPNFPLEPDMTNIYVHWDTGRLVTKSECIVGDVVYGKCMFESNWN